MPLLPKDLYDFGQSVRSLLMTLSGVLSTAMLENITLTAMLLLPDHRSADCLWHTQEYPANLPVDITTLAVSPISAGVVSLLEVSVIVNKYGA